MNTQPFTMREYTAGSGKWLVYGPTLPAHGEMFKGINAEVKARTLRDLLNASYEAGAQEAIAAAADAARVRE